MIVRGSRVAVVWRKELVDGLRDRRSCLMALFGALLGPLVLVPMIAFMAKSFASSDAPLSVPMAGADRAPGLVEALRDRNITVRPAPGDPRAAVRDQKEDVVLLVSDSYADDVRAGRPAAVQVVTDESRTASRGRVHRVIGVLEMYGQTVGVQRLLARGVRPAITNPLAIELDDVSTPEEHGALLLSSIPVFVMIALVMGGMYVAVDVTAGERERGSLEPLLANPISDAEAVLGKLAAVGTFAAASVVACIAAFVAAIRVSPSIELTGMRFEVSTAGAFAIAAAVLPLAPGVAAIELVVAGRAKSVREAQSAIWLFQLLAMFPGLLLTFTQIPRWLVAVPFVGQQALVADVLRGTLPGLGAQLVAGSTALVLGAILALAAVAQQTRSRAAPSAPAP